MDSDAHAKVSDDNVTVGVLGAIKNVFGSEDWVKREGYVREKSALEVLVDDAMVVKVVNTIENGADHSDRIVLGKLFLCEDTVKELSASGEFERKVIFCARLEALVKLDLCRVRMSWGGRERRTMLGWLRPVRRLISAQTLASFLFILSFLMTVKATWRGGWTSQRAS